MRKMIIADIMDLKRLEQMQDFRHSMDVWRSMYYGGKIDMGNSRRKRNRRGGIRR